MMTEAEWFFIERIRQGLQGDQFLSHDEEEILLAPIDEIVSSERFSSKQAKCLEEKCIAALTKSYKEDTKNKNKRSAVEWARHNRNIYNHSRRVISGVVQNWYLGVGRSLEKQVVRGASHWVIDFIILVLIVSSAIWILM